MPAIKELQALQKALVNGQVDFDGKNDYFFTSTPSSADPNGLTTGFAYYVKMQNGKRGISRRDSEYNVIALRRKNAWKGPESAGGNGTVDKDPSWNEEENIMQRGISRRDSEYNVIALRRKNAWKGPESAGGNGTVDKDPSWNEEENIMPK